jgi:hypothetical protein
MEKGFKIELFIDKRPNGILQPSGMLGNNNDSDFYVNVPLYRNIALFEDYVNITSDPFKTVIDRQLINPYFIELGFFETVDSVSGTTDSIVNKAPSYGITINK